ncbi:MAG: TIGR03960 family B12-binding radical SAM protein [Spirochaetota bacterium]
MRYTLEMLAPLLEQVEKPARYVGGEFNSIVKDHADIRFALCYPDLYDVGMANNGIQILYGILNSMDGIACERIFAAAPDYMKLLKENQLSLYTLETLTPVHACDILGLNLSHELLYTTVLYILDGCGIPLLSEERTDDHPLIIAGGEATSNPGPMHDFIDIFYFGEGEAGICAVAEAVRAGRADGVSRKELLRRTASLDGVFVPSLASITTNSDGMICYTGLPVAKCTSNELSVNVARKPVVPSLRTAQDRAVVEITRGCDNLCKFCHAGYYTLPYRTYGWEEAARDALEILDNTGYDGVTFTSLSISDYRHLVPLLNHVLPELNRRGVGINLPSLKVDRNTIQLVETLSRVKQVSLTFAVESACTEIRKMIHKRLSLDELYEIVQYVFSRGWRTIKLYFMLGLPGYQEHDEVAAMVDLLHRINEIGRGRKDIHVTVSPFVPKPHTPFDRVNMAPVEYFLESVKRIRASVPRKVSVKNHLIAASYVEGFLSRGDLRTGSAILSAYRKGCFLDSWDEYFNKEAWLCVLDVIDHRASYYGERHDRLQPWSVVSTGCDALLDAKSRKVLTDEELSGKRMKITEPINSQAIEESMHKLETRYERMVSARMRFTKTGRARYLSHLDLAEVIKRALRIARLPLCVSRGFNKREQLAFGYPLPLGIESECEYVDCSLHAMADETAADAVNRALPEGIRLVKLIFHNEKSSVMTLSHVTEYRVECSDEKAERLFTLCSDSGAEIVKRTKKGERRIRIAQALHSVVRKPYGLCVRLYNGTEESIRIDSLVHEVDDGCSNMVHVVKSDVYSLNRAENTLIPIIA